MSNTIYDAIFWGMTYIGRPYDHGPTNCRFLNCPNNLKADCSGLICACLWHIGMPFDAMPQSSGDMARWASNTGRLMPISVAKRTFGAILTAGGFSNGDAGHVVFSLGDGQRTFESSGSRGVCIDNINRMTWDHGFLAPVNYTPPIPEDEVEHGMAVDAVINPAKPTQGYVLDRWGGIHPFGGAPVVHSTGYWAGKDVARKVVIADWATGKGYVLDLDGAMHPFNGAPKLSGTPYWRGGKIVPFSEL